MSDNEVHIQQVFGNRSACKVNYSKHGKVSL